MLNGIIIGTSNTLQSIYYLLPNISPNLHKYRIQIEELDIEFKLNIVNNWIKKDDNSSEIKNGIGESCIKISNILDEINKEISYHNTKYFASYRTLDLSILIDKLKHQCTILNSRISLHHFH